MGQSLAVYPNNNHFLQRLSILSTMHQSMTKSRTRRTSLASYIIARYGRGKATIASKQVHLLQKLYQLSSPNEVMVPTDALAAISLMITVAVAGNAAFLSLKLKTRSSDGAALCAMDDPTVNAEMSPKLPGAPEPVRCAMTCTDDVGCEHFNYLSTESKPCQLYRYRPTNFDVSANCQHYYNPGL